MIRKFFTCVTPVIVVALLWSGLSARASEPARDYLEAVTHYNEGEFTQAAGLFERVADQGVVNGKLYYNIGNAYAKQGDVGHAMLWYERALKLIPHDPDLIYNHTYVSGLLKDKVEERTSPVYTVLFFWKDLLNPGTVRWLAIGFFGFFWILVLVAMVRSKRIMGLLNSVLLIFALIFSMTGYYDYYTDHFHKKAVVLTDTVSVRSGLSDESTELFVLHSGTRIGVDDERRGYIKIRFSGDKIGWVKKEDVEII